MTKKNVTGPSLTDVDKIEVQLFLDVAQLGTQLEKLGVSKDFVPYNTLLGVVAVGRKVLYSDDIILQLKEDNDK